MEDVAVRFPIRRGVLARTQGLVHAVESVSLEVARGETLGLAGESGCGKTTTGRSIIKLYDITSGSIYFKGKRIVPVVGIPEHTMVLGEFSTGMDSNLWMGVDYANDTDILKIDRLQANSELFFFQMRMKMDVNIVRPAEIVVHTAYKKSE